MSSVETIEEHINVFVRIWPHNTEECEATPRSIYIEDNGEGKVINIPSHHNKMYHFEHVFDTNASLTDVYDTVIKPIIKDVLNGYNYTVFTYGQTGTGKTCTMFGPPDNTNIGVIYKACLQIFDSLLHVAKVKVFISCLDLCNEELVDVLADGARSTCRIYEDVRCKGVVKFEDIRKVAVTCAEDLEQILRTVRKQKSANCSRSHTIFTLGVLMRETNFMGEEVVKNGKLSFVDLAGSESKTSEDKNVNQSLFTLRRVIIALTKKLPHVPYRESKLTRILRDSLKGRSKATMIATISADWSDLDETINTLEYASKVKTIVNFPKVYQKISRALPFKHYVEEIHKLRKDLEATRTSVGVQLSKDCYNKMLAKRDSQHRQLREEMRQIGKEEVEHEAMSVKLVEVEGNWGDLVRFREQLTSDLQELNVNLSVTKQQKDEKQKQLLRFKHKYKKSVGIYQDLMSKAAAQHELEEKLHAKVTLLYDTFEENAAITKDFNALFSQLNNDVVKQLWNMIDSAQQAILNNSEEVRNDLHTTYNTVKSTLDRLCLFCSNIQKHKVEYDAIKESYRGEKFEKVESAEDLTVNINECFNGFVESLTKVKCEHLYALLQHIRRLGDGRDRNYIALADCLVKIHEVTANCASKLAHIIYKTTRRLLKQVPEVLAVSKQQSDSVVMTAHIGKEIEREFSEILDAVWRDINETEEAASVMLSTVENNFGKSDCVRDALVKVGGEWAQTSQESFGKIQAGTNECCLSISGKINEVLASYANLAAENETSRCHLAMKSKRQMELFKQDVKKLGDSCNEIKVKLADFGSDFCATEEKHGNHLKRVNDLWEDVGEKNALAVVALKNICECADAASDEIKGPFERVKMEVDSTRLFLDQYHARVTEATEKFCHQDLRRPTHGGDTPQRQTNFSLDLSSVSLLDYDDDEQSSAPSTPVTSRGGLHVSTNTYCRGELAFLRPKHINVSQGKENVDSDTS